VTDETENLAVLTNFRNMESLLLSSREEKQKSAALSRAADFHLQYKLNYFTGAFVPFSARRFKRS
jgi:hypothetical protein